MLKKTNKFSIHLKKIKVDAHINFLTFFKGEEIHIIKSFITDTSTRNTHSHPIIK